MFKINLLKNLSKGNLGNFKWYNKPDRWNFLPEGGLEIFASNKTDFFQDPTNNFGVATAPLFYLDINDDFIAKAKLKPNFNCIYDGGGIMVYENEKSWIKLCYENTDLGCPAIVSVVTNKVSDDANGVEINLEQLHLQIVRKGEYFCLFYSKDGDNWRMVRYFKIKMPKTVRVGLEAQSPLGEGTTIIFNSFIIEEKTVNNLRKGK